MFQRIKHAFCRLLGIKTRPYLTPSPLPKGPIIEPLTPSTLIYRRKPEGPANESASGELRWPNDGDLRGAGSYMVDRAYRSDPVYDTWPDPFRQQRPKRVDPRPRPLLRAVTRDDDPPETISVRTTPPPGATALEVIFADAVMRSVSSTPTPAPEPEPLPDFSPIFGGSPAPAPSYNSDYGCSRDYTPDAPSDSSSDSDSSSSTPSSTD